MKPVNQGRVPLENECASVPSHQHVSAAANKEHCGAAAFCCSVKALNQGIEQSNAMPAREHVARLGNTRGSWCEVGAHELCRLLPCITERHSPHSSGIACSPLCETSFNFMPKRIV